MESPGIRPILVVVVAAGRSERFGGVKKELAPLRAGVSVIDAALSPFLRLPGLAALVLVAPAGREEELRSALSPSTLEMLGDRFAVAAGGRSRRDSVLNGVQCLADSGLSPEELDGAVVLVHDGARPWASAALAARVAEAAAERGAAVPVASLVDTPKEIGPGGTVLRHLPRSSIAGAQTPQGFRFRPFLEALRRAAAEGVDCTDDAELWARYAGAVVSVEGELANRKVTYPEDLPDRDARGSAPRVGAGWDRHRLVPGRRLLVGGVEIPSELGEEAHSDGDVLLHAVVDALLGAAALGDIGGHFPPSDPAWKDADSRDLAREASALVRAAGFLPGNLDCTVMLERPRLGPHREAVRASIAECLGLPVGAVSVKAKTGEGLDAVGEGRAIEAQAIVTLLPLPRSAGGP